MKVFISAACSLFEIAALILWVDSSSFFDSGKTWLIFPAVLCAAAGLFLPGWFNSKSGQKAAAGVIAGFILGCFGFFVVGPLFSQIFQKTFFHTVIQYGAYSFIWPLLFSISGVQIITGPGNEEHQWQGLLLGFLGTWMLVTILEVITIPFGQGSNISIFKLAFYAPLIWGSITAGTTRSFS